MNSEPRIEHRQRAIGCLSFLVLLSSIPLGVVGVILHGEASSSRGATPLSGLSSVVAAVGVAFMVAALVALFAGAFAFVRSARD